MWLLTRDEGTAEGEGGLVTDGWGVRGLRKWLPVREKGKKKKNNNPWGLGGCLAGCGEEKIKTQRVGSCVSVGRKKICEGGRLP